VLAAAGTKWNFLPFSPGLVGGHCIGVDPYYLTMLAQSLGYHPEVILAGRRINDNMGTYIAQRLVKSLVHQDIPVRGAKVAVLGLTFKENVPDLRNSRIPDILKELKTYGINALVHDAISDPAEAMHEYGVRLTPWKELSGLDAVVIGVAHNEYKKMPINELLSIVRPGGVVADVKSVLDPASIPANLQYWCL
jgi:UDP-N-acetyl-D-galactosamine dehydrogenase